MRLGVCTPFENIETAERLGYDFIEPALSQVALLPDTDFEAASLRVAEVSIGCEALNMLFPQGIRLIGPEADRSAAEVYVQKAFPRAAALGADIVVFGSGGARRCPDGFSEAEAHRQLVDICLMLGEEAVRNGFVVVLEPLNSKECNLITSVQEGLALVQEVNHPGFALLADFYHMEQEAEELAVLRACAPWLRHCHVSYGPQRAYLTQDNLPGCAAFIELLESIGYQHRLSIEGITDDFARDAAGSFACLCDRRGAR